MNYAQSAPTVCKAISADSSRPDPGPRTHLIGIGGAGMAALATCLAEIGHAVSGSDLRSTETTRKLAARGVRVVANHVPDNVAGADLVVVSDAVPTGNLELKEANIRMIPVVRRAQMLDRICQSKFAAMVSGSHGKSSITAMLATVLDSAGAEPSFALGADIPALAGERARIGRGAHFVVEACEAFGNLASYNPGLSVIANIDGEHSAHYGGQERLDAAFADFANRAPGGAVVNGDDPGVRRIFDRLTHPITFGLDPVNTFSAAHVQIDAQGAAFEVVRAGLRLGCVRLAVGGRHMVLNALACVAAGMALGIGFGAIAAGLRRYTGIHRRWQVHDTGGGPGLIDDFAHHPTELEALIDTARTTLPGDRRLVIAFQPQLYSRTKALLNDFGRVLARFDAAWVLDIDGAGETDSGEISSADLVAAIRRHDGTATGVGNAAALLRRIPQCLRSGDTLITAGAGSIAGVVEPIACVLRDMNSADVVADVPAAPAVRESGRAHRRGLATSTGTVLNLFAMQVDSQPQAPAVNVDGATLSYGQLDAQAEALARRLLALGLALQGVVGVHAPSSIELIVAVLAIAKAGGIYLPVDPGLPAGRMGFMLRDAQARFLLTAGGAPLDQGMDVAVLHFDELMRASANASGSAASVAIAGEHTAYVCYTSGSTGRPKGVAIRHGCLANFAAAAIDRFAVAPGTRMALNTAIGFDVSLGEIWMTLCAGGELFATGSAKPLIGDALCDFVDRNRITHLAITPTVLSTMPTARLASLRCVIAAGEACPPALVARWAPGRRFFNAYGPTEATIYASVGECHAQGAVNIGTPLAHVALRILDGDLREVDDGAVGELCIGGAGVAAGYIALPAETASRFIAWHGPVGRIERLYRSGDLVRRNGDGNLCFVGRLDSQVKILGSRVELEEIEQTLLARFPALLDVAVAFDAGRGGNGRLVCFAVTREDEFDWETARGDLEDWLPAYMVPADFVVVERMKITPSGKKDRAGLLAAHPHGQVRRGEYIAPSNALEARIAAIWKTVLNLDTDVGVDERFDWLGGDSLKALQIVMAVEESCDVAVSPGYFGALSTVGRMAIQLADLLWDRASRAPEPSTGFRATRVYKELRNITANWAGERADPDALIVSVGAGQPAYQFLLCVQIENEVHGFAAALGDDFRVHGLRSGHLVMQYDPESLDMLCAHYVEEIEQAQLQGKLLVGGICQGALVAIRLARMLRERGHALELVALIEQSKIAPVEGDVAFYFSEDSFANPFRRFACARSRFEAVYGKNYSLDIVPGAHGHIHEAPQVHILAHKLRARLGAGRAASSLREASGHSPESAPLPSGRRQAKADIAAAKPVPEPHSAEIVDADAKLIEASGFLDPDYYWSQLKDGSPSGLAAAHYGRWGWMAGLDPGPRFSTRGYLERNYDVRDAGVNPLAHYLRFGASEGRGVCAVSQDLEEVRLVQASGFLDPDFYSAQLKGVALTGPAAAAHYVRWGWRDGLDPGPHFSTLGYFERYPDVRDGGANPLLHYLRHGMGEGRSAWSEAEVARWQGGINVHRDAAVAGLREQPRFAPRLRRGDRVAIHAHSRGHFAFRQFQRMLAQAFGAIGIQCTLETEASGPVGPAPALRIVVAPHDFFHLHPLPDSRSFADAALFNSEQMPSVWFNRALPRLMAAPLVLDIHFQTAACLAELGARAVYLPLGIVPGNEIFRLLPDLSAEPAVRGLPDDMKRPIAALSNPLAERGIDVLFVGSNSDRRTRYFTEHSAFFAVNRCFIRLVDVIGPLEETHPRGITARAFAGLAQRSKILMNIHHFDAPYFEWQRLVHYGFAQRCCVVTERCSRPPGFVPGVHYLEDDKHALPALMDWLLHDPDGQEKMEKVGRAGYEMARDSLRLDSALRRLFRLDEPADAP